jgi:hypothetical protein
MADELAVPDNLSALLSNYLEDLSARTNQITAGVTDSRVLMNAAAGLPEENTKPDATDDETARQWLESVLPQVTDLGKLAGGIGQAFDKLSGKSPDLASIFDSADTEAADKARGFGGSGPELDTPSFRPLA